MARYSELLTAMYASLPRWYARMQTAGSAKKYLTVHQPLTVRLGELHWLGTITIAVPLSGHEGQAQVAAADLDVGGELVIGAWLAAARALGYVAWGSVVNGSAGHTGGHVWLFFDQLAALAQLRLLMVRIGRAAGYATQEVYPSGKALRLPFGIHTTTGSRGRLILQDGQRYDLDDDAEREAAPTRVLTLPRNASGDLPAVPTPEEPTRSASVTPGGAGSVIDAYNQETDLLGLLQRYGAKIAEQWNTGALLHCPCRGHQHGDRRPSLQVKAATNPRYGHWIAVGYSPSCQFHTEQGQITHAFDVYCRMEGLTPAEAVKSLTQQRVNARATGR